jgi:hypothetical protein
VVGGLARARQRAPEGALLLAVRRSSCGRPCAARSPERRLQGLRKPRRRERSR